MFLSLSIYYVQWALEIIADNVKNPESSNNNTHKLMFSCPLGGFSSKNKWSHSVMSNSLWPIDCSLPGSSVDGIFQAIVLEWIAISFSRGSSQPLILAQYRWKKLFGYNPTYQAQVFGIWWLGSKSEYSVHLPSW